MNRQKFIINNHIKERNMCYNKIIDKNLYDTLKRKKKT